MGMNLKQILYFFEALFVIRRENYGELAVCVLGNQVVRKHAQQFEEFRYATFVELLRARGFARVESIDVNGRDGALVLDLSKPLAEGAPDLVGRFDIVANPGTSEHVMVEQWQVFKNIHDLLKPDGLAVHFLPVEPRGHGFWTYSEPYIARVAKACGYHIVDVRVTQNVYKYNYWKHYLFAALLKVAGSQFVEREKWEDPEVDALGVSRYAAGYNEYLNSNLEKGMGHHGG